MHSKPIFYPILIKSTFILPERQIIALYNVKFFGIS